MARKFSSPVAFRQALERRLKNIADERGVPLNTLRLKLMIERLLARRFARPNAPWLLKGGYAMELRYPPNARTTMDIDLSISAAKPKPDLTTPLEPIRVRIFSTFQEQLGTSEPT